MTSHQNHSHATGSGGISTEVSSGVERLQTEFAFIANAAYDQVVPLFGAHAERAWAGEYWDPQFLYPNPPRDVPGAVFSTHQNGLRATWINTAFDLEIGHIQYVYFVPETLATMIDIKVSRQGASHTAVQVIYTRTALRPEANDKVREMAEIDRNASEEWRNAIDGAMKATVNPMN
jgi:hypothetical protein